MAYGKGSKCSMKEGMTRHNPPGDSPGDKSLTPGNFVGRKAGSVNSYDRGSELGSTAPTPKTLGPRVA